MDNTHVVWHDHRVVRSRGCVVWFTGLSGSGKSTIANLVDFKLNELGARSFVLDGDNIRHGLNASTEMLAAEHNNAFAKRFGLGFSPDDREENIRRVGSVAELFCSAGLIALVAFVSPYRKDRDAVRRNVEANGSTGDFIEVLVDAPLEICEQRDPKGLYKKARAGELSDLTGIDAPYEPPVNPDLVLDSSTVQSDDLAQRVVAHLSSFGKAIRSC